MFELPDPVLSSAAAAAASEDSQSEEDVKCRLAIRGVILAFKSVPQLEKNVETCAVTVCDSEYKVKIQFNCRFKVTKTYTLPFIETESLKVKL